RLDGGERVLTVRAGDGAPGTGEVRVEWRRMLVTLVDVPAGGVGLPDLDQLIAKRAAPAVEQLPGDGDAFAERLTGVLQGEVGLDRGDITLTERRRHQFD